MSLKIISAVAASFAIAAISLSIGSAVAAPANNDWKAKPHRVHHGYANHRWPGSAYPATLPYGPEYGFLAHVPPNAIRMPGYTFVPGVGILGESCDLPSGACSNAYRDIQ